MEHFQKNNFDIETLKEKVDVLEKNYRNLHDDLLKLSLNISNLENSTNKIEHLEQTLIRFEETARKLSELASNYNELNNEIQSMKVSRSVDNVIMGAVKFIGGVVVVGMLSVVFSLIFGIPVKI